MKYSIVYKNYFTKIKYSAEDNVLFGKIEGIKDSVSFHGDSSEEVSRAFHEAVDDYIEFCEKNNKPLLKSYKGFL